MGEQGVGLEHQTHLTLVGGFVCDVLAVQHNAPGFRRQQARNGPHGGSFAAARGAQQSQQLTLPDRERQIVNSSLSTVTQAQVFQR